MQSTYDENEENEDVKISQAVKSTCNDKKMLWYMYLPYNRKQEQLVDHVLAEKN